MLSQSFGVIFQFSDSPRDMTPTSDKTVYASVGDSLNISATVLACPKPTSVHWRKTADPSITLESHITDLVEDDYLLNGIVKQVTTQHYGTYECIVENGIGNSLKAKFEVKLKGKYYYLLFENSPAHKLLRCQRFVKTVI